MVTFTAHKPRQKPISTSKIRSSISHIISFLLGCAIYAVCTTVLLHSDLDTSHPNSNSDNLPRRPLPLSQPLPKSAVKDVISHPNIQKTDDRSSSSQLDGLRILVAIASYDFSQIPHLEEMLDSVGRDVCEAGAHVDLVIHTTEPYPIPYIDLLNSRLTCTNPSSRSNLSVRIVLKSPGLRLNLVDCHRELFYDNLEDYDLFVYSEDDIRITPTTLAAYLYETGRVKDLVGAKEALNYNVGITRYEYNYPPDIVIDDKTRHATKNVTRVYWEHTGISGKLIIGGVADTIPQGPPLSEHYLGMKNDHQGMFMATREHLRDWKTRPNCKFDVIRQRPGIKTNPGQPAEGTQRVWMSTRMLYGSKHCGVQQLLPMDNFGSLNVHHLPNKNYRRVGKKGRIGGDHEGAEENHFSDGTEKFRGPDPGLLQAMKFHVAIRKRYPKEPSKGVYKGITMVDEIKGSYKHQKEHRERVDKTMRDFNAYSSRGGVMLESDMELVSPNGAFLF